MSLQPKILFILKQRQGSGGWVANCSSSGLYNSAKFIVDMLQKSGFDVKLVDVIDANDIDREVTKYQPTNVVLEAIWVPPTKFQELARLHPTVKWVIRIHSEIPFIASEGMSLTWIPEYIKYDNVSISANSERMLNELRLIVQKSQPNWHQKTIADKVIYLPNFYPATYYERDDKKIDSSIIDVGCFGAVRPMKNHLLQAVASIHVAHKMRKKLRFHVNGTRLEQGGENILKNLQALMISTNNELVIEPWVDHTEFINIVSKMDIGLQVSFSETFNIVAADKVMAELPIVVSPEVKWACDYAKANPTDSKDIANTMQLVLQWPMNGIIKKLNVHGLKKFSEEAQEYWLMWLNTIDHSSRHFGL